MNKANDTQSRAEIKRILLGNRGAMASVARDLGVSRIAISLVLGGNSTSSRILAACAVKARGLAGTDPQQQRANTNEEKN